MTRSAYVLEEQGVVVFWSRKAGNTSLSDWLLQANLTQGENQRRGRRRLKEGNIKVEPEDALRLIRERNFDHYVLARNPFGRAASMYVAQFISNKGVVRDRLDTLSRFGRNTYLEVMKARGESGDADAYSETLPGITFIEFLNHLKAKILGRSEGREPDLNNHLNTQVPFLFEGSRFEYSNIMRLENVAQEILPLAKRLKIDRPFPSENKNATRPMIGEKGEFSRTPSHVFTGEGQVPARAALLDAEAISMIRETFEIDFRKLAYDPAAV